MVGGDDYDAAQDVLCLLPWMLTAEYIVRVWVDATRAKLIGVCFLNEVGDYVDGDLSHACGIDVLYYVEHLCVAPEWCGRGVGSALLRAISGAGLLTVVYVKKRAAGGGVGHDALAAWYEAHGYVQVEHPVRLPLNNALETLLACEQLQDHPWGV